MNREERHSVLRERAREMRSHMTPEEYRLWYQFLSRYPIRFLRQYVIGDRYILDFYARSLKLAVEVDGSQHYDEEGRQRDAERTRFLETKGIRVLRFTNHEVHREFRHVCEVIDAAARGEW